MFAAIVLLEDLAICESKITGEIDNASVPRQARYDVERLAMWEREENAVNICERLHLLRSCSEHQIRQAQQVTMNFANPLSRMFIRRNEKQINLRVKQ
jgi:hypothetical protein